MATILPNTGRGIVSINLNKEELQMLIEALEKTIVTSPPLRIGIALDYIIKSLKPYNR